MHMLRVDHLLLVVQDRQANLALREAFRKLLDTYLRRSGSSLCAGRFFLERVDPDGQAHRLPDNHDHQADRQFDIGECLHREMISHMGTDHPYR